MTAIQIATAALLKNGQHETLAATWETAPATKAAELCSIFYAQARRAILRLQPWTCAKKRAKLYGGTWEASTAYEAGDIITVTRSAIPEQYTCSTAGTTGSSAPTWSASAEVTDGTAKWLYWKAVLKAIPDDNETNFDYMLAIPADYIRSIMVLDENGDIAESSMESGILYTDTELPTLIYVYDNTDPTTWDPLITEAVILQLASSIAYALSGSHENEVAFSQAAMGMVQAAFTQTKREQRQRPMPTDSWISGLFPEVKR